MFNINQLKQYFITINKEKESEAFVSKDELLSYFTDKKINVFGILHNKESNLHYHLYVQRNSPIKFDMLHNDFPTAHIEKCVSSRSDIYKYFLHEDKDKEPYAEDEVFTNISNLIDFISVNQDIDKDIVDMAFSGKTATQILRKHPSIWRSFKNLEYMCTAIEENKVFDNSSGSIKTDDDLPF